MTKTKFLLILLLSCCSSLVFGQQIVCNNVDFALVPIPKDDSSAVFKYRLGVKLDLSVSEMKTDTVILTTNTKFCALGGPTNLKVVAVNKDSTVLKSWIVDNGPFSTQSLKFIAPTLDGSKFFVTYEVLGTGFILYIQNIATTGPPPPRFFAFHSDFEYFFPMDVPMLKIGEIKTPKDILTFSGHWQDDLGRETINLTFIDTFLFKKERIELPNIVLNTYIADTLTTEVALIGEVGTYLNKLSSLSSFVNKGEKETNLIFTKWRNDEKREAYGRVFGDHFICDYNMQARGILHEILHILLPSNLRRESKGKFFIGESIIEWLTLFLSDNLDKLSSDVEIREQNLYDISINDNSTRTLIYSYGPSILQRVAAMSSEEEVANAIVGFLQATADAPTDYSEFLLYLEKHLPQNLIQDMDSMVRGE